MAISSAVEVYNASYNYKTLDEASSNELSLGDTFWGEVEISEDNDSKSDLVAFTSSILFKPTHVYVRKNIKTHIPDSISINLGNNENASLVIDREIVDFHFLHAYREPIIGTIGFFSVHTNWLPTVELPEVGKDGDKQIAKGIVKGKKLYAKYKVEALNPLVISTNNPYAQSKPERLWEQYTNGFFWPFAHILAGFFLIIDILLVYSFVKQRVRRAH